MLLLSIGGALSAFGSAGANIASGMLQNRAAMQRARAQMEFQERMSSTSYQRAMGDMRAAGLNPMLAYQKGGASTPGGALAPVVPELEKGVATALQARRLTTELENVEAHTAETKVDTEQKRLELGRFEEFGGSVIGRNVQSLLQMGQSLWDKGKVLNQNPKEGYFEWLHRRLRDLLGIDETTATKLPPIKKKRLKMRETHPHKKKGWSP